MCLVVYTHIHTPKKLARRVHPIPLCLLPSPPSQSSTPFPFSVNLPVLFLPSSTSWKLNPPLPPFSQSPFLAPPPLLWQSTPLFSFPPQYSPISLSPSPYLDLLFSCNSSRASRSCCIGGRVPGNQFSFNELIWAFCKQPSFAPFNQGPNMHR